MNRYAVSFETLASTVVYVEADSPEDARAKADEKFEAPMVCAQCSGWGGGEADGNSGIELSDSWEQTESEHGVWEA
jgi:hypothetical protein